jgi:hypothetical protein
MGGRRRIKLGMQVGLACVLAALAAVSSSALESGRRRGRIGQELMYFPSGLGLRPLGLGHPLTLADLLWLRGIQYYGEHRLSDNRFLLAGHVFETITELDPHFVDAYVFGGIVLAGEGEDLKRGLRLLRRGMAWNPESWELAFETGFIYYVAAHDDIQAAHFFERARRLPGAPPLVTRFAAHLRARTGDDLAALVLWEEFLRSTTHPALRDLAEFKIQSIRKALASAGSETKP